MQTIISVQVVVEPEEADFVLAHGTEVLGRGDGQDAVPKTLEEFRNLLQQSAARDIPLVVANPDVVTVSGTSLIPMPGTFAQWYREMGGKVASFSPEASTSAKGL